MSKAQMIDNRSAYRTPILPGGNKITAQMPAHNGVGHKGDAVYHEQPGEKEVPAPRHGKPLPVGYGKPGREAAFGQFSRRVSGGAEESGCIEFVAEDAGDAGDFSFIVFLAPHLQYGGNAAVRRLAPVERRMGVENIETAHQEYGKENDIAPVHDAHRQWMPVIQISAGSGAAQAFP